MCYCLFKYIACNGVNYLHVNVYVLCRSSILTSYVFNSVITYKPLLCSGSKLLNESLSPTQNAGENKKFCYRT